MNSDKKTFFINGTKRLSVNIMSLLIGLFGAFVINIITTPPLSWFTVPAIISFCLLVFLIYKTIRLVETFENCKETTKNNSAEPLQKSELEGAVFADYPEIDFGGVYHKLVCWSCAALIAGVGSLCIANLSIDLANQHADRNKGRVDSIISIRMQVMEKMQI